ncbi:flagellar basal body rod protein FlgB [Thermosediminibacter oceani]|uniref:Flagellar basal body rod protein FlgB n=1 Tax=Thermosediminibacter oceani (strain ATCC BAA-1034 / DSM 16646 / JW/IW-1228P) TaxID=555079 RepID=D9S376_THEOJ|nr:flagellar basal body rod protein FlgB [Thermosediminibacter oceani]ADL07853.1 flagellar basal-body rod protein FlgB [Thermosediminibacter oceani DSM 16646]
MVGLFETANLLQKIMDAKWMRHEVLANNIANVDTPNFKRSDVVFEELLQKYLKESNSRLPLKTTSEKHISNLKPTFDLKPEIVMQHDRVLRNDGNNVDIDKEMVELVENTLSYNIMAEQVQRQFSLLRSAITEGRR